MIWWGVIFALSYAFIFDFILLLDEFLFRIFQKKTLWNFNDVSISFALALIPVSAYLATNKLSIPNLKGLFAMILWNLVSVVCFCILAFLVAGALPNPVSPLLPTYIVFQPMPFYWELAVFTGVLTPLVIVIIRSRLRRRKMIFAPDEKTLDQS